MVAPQPCYSLLTELQFVGQPQLWLVQGEKHQQLIVAPDTWGHDAGLAERGEAGLGNADISVEFVKHSEFLINLFTRAILESIDN